MSLPSPSSFEQPGERHLQSLRQPDQRRRRWNVLPRFDAMKVGSRNTGTPRKFRHGPAFLGAHLPHVPRDTSPEVLAAAAPGIRTPAVRLIAQVARILGGERCDRAVVEDDLHTSPELIHRASDNPPASKTGKLFVTHVCVAQIHVPDVKRSTHWIVDARQDVRHPGAIVLGCVRPGKAGRLRSRPRALDEPQIDCCAHGPATDLCELALRRSRSLRSLCSASFARSWARRSCSRSDVTRRF